MRVCAVGLFCALALFSCSNPNVSRLSEPLEAWDATNDPAQLANNFETRLERLPLDGVVSAPTMLWSESGWPNVTGGIAARWFESYGLSGFGYKPPSEAEVRTMKRDDLKKLSPAEKYDIYMGRFDFPTVAHERNRTSPHDAGWYGLCHGFANASTLYGEPRAMDLQGPSGVVVPFGSSDIKALLIFYIGEIKRNEGSRVIGLRCNTDYRRHADAAGSPECRDVNPGSFHVVLSNKVGLRNESFVIEHSPGAQVWNQPVLAYHTSIMEEAAPFRGAAPGTVKQVRVQTRLRTVKGTTPQWYPIRGSTFQRENYQPYDYWLDVDAQGRILGGEWISDDHPDFLWQPAKVSFEGYYALVEEIWNATKR